MKTRSAALLALGLVACVVSASADNSDNSTSDINLGVVLSTDQLDALPVHVFVDGTGLPDGSGTASQGAQLYDEHCASCHGNVGQGGKAIELKGDRSLLGTAYPDKGIAVYWPHAPTLYEYINRSMPPRTPGMFTSDELYALIAYLLHLNGIFDKDAVLDKQVLSAIQLPNRDGFNTLAR